MKVLILSDLHLEHWGFDNDAWHGVEADVVVLAGDICAPVAKGITWAANTFPRSKVLVVAGNHESYGYDYAVTIAAMAATASMYENVWFLHKDAVLVDGVVFLGATLWTDFCLYGDHHQEMAMARAERGMNDYRAITLGDKRLTAQDTLRMHKDEKLWLEAMLAEPTNKKRVVITHHLPSSKSVPELYKGDLLNPAFVSDIEPVVQQAESGFMAIRMTRLTTS